MTVSWNKPQPRAVPRGPVGAQCQVIKGDPDHPTLYKGTRVRLTPRAVAHIQCVKPDGTIRWEDDAIFNL